MRQPHSPTVVRPAVSRSEESYIFPADNLGAVSYLSLLRDEYISTSKLFFSLHFSTQSFVCRIAMSSSLTLLLFLVKLQASIRPATLRPTAEKRQLDTGCTWQGRTYQEGEVMTDEKYSTCR